MNLARVSKVLAGFVAFFTLVQLVPFVMSLAETPVARGAATAGFLGSLAIGAVVAVLLWMGGRRAVGEMYRKESLCVAGVAWLLASLLGAIPFQWSGLLPNPADAVFETVSGLTTCGGTVLGTGGNPTPEDTVRSLLLWRAMLQWIGGIGIVLIFVALLPSMGGAGRNLLMAESVGVGQEGHQPRVLSQARGVGALYVGLTAACIVALVGIGGMGWFDAVCNGFAVLSTGGFSTRSSIALFDSLGAEVVMTVFMFVAGSSLTVMAVSVRDGWHGLGSMVKTSEFRMYSLFTASMVAFVAVDLVRAGAPIGSALRQASFNVVSILTSSGFATAEFSAWPPVSLLLLLACMMVGGCSGSTAGGMKQVRLLVCLKLLAYTVRRFVRPKSVERLRLDDDVLQASTVSSVLAIVLMWLLAVLVGAVVLALDQRLSLGGALSASASMLGNTGPALAWVVPEALENGLPAIGQGVAVVGPNIGALGGYGDLHGWTKVVMSFEMVLGRLELLPLLVLCMPSFWRR